MASASAGGCSPISRRPPAGLGYRRVVLDTNDTLDEAIAMYGAPGYQPTERYNDNPYAQRWFVKQLA